MLEEQYRIRLLTSFDSKLSFLLHEQRRAIFDPTQLPD
jgi:hypothetical protein